MVRKDDNSIGAKDLQSAIRMMSECSGWEKNAFISPIAVEGNERIATSKLSEVLLTRWLVFNLLIDVARSPSATKLGPSIRQKWLLFQTPPWSSSK